MHSNNIFFYDACLMDSFGNWFASLLNSFIICVLLIYFSQNIIQTAVLDQTIYFAQILLFLPFSVKSKLILFQNYRQKIYNKITLMLLNKTFTRWFILKLHVILLYFRYLSVKGFNYIESYIPLSTFAILLSIICSRLHIAVWMIVFCLFIIRLDFAFVSMSRFYRDHPGIFNRNFPHIPANARGMWSQASKIAVEAASNPQVQATALAIGGALAWKGLDVYETLKQEGIAEADRVAENTRAEDNRLAENARADADRNAAAIQAEADRYAVATQADADRREENRRLAFSIYNSNDFNNLSDEQKANVKTVLETGVLKP